MDIGDLLNRAPLKTPIMDQNSLTELGRKVLPCIVEGHSVQGTANVLGVESEKVEKELRLMYRELAMTAAQCRQLRDDDFSALIKWARKSQRTAVAPAVPRNRDRILGRPTKEKAIQGPDMAKVAKKIAAWEKRNKGK